MSTCALALRATIAPLGQPLLAVSCIRLGGASLTIGRAVVTTHYANCTQCTAGYYQDFDSQQEGECVSCPTGYYSAGAPPPPLLTCIWITRRGEMLQRVARLHVPDAEQGILPMFRAWRNATPVHPAATRLAQAKATVISVRLGNIAYQLPWCAATDIVLPLPGLLAHMLGHPLSSRAHPATTPLTKAWLFANHAGLAPVDSSVSMAHPTVNPVKQAVIKI